MAGPFSAHIRHRIPWLLLLLPCWCGLPLYAQLPATQLFVFDLTKEGGEWQLTHPRLLTADHGGYTNQPYFLDSNRLLVSSDAGEAGKTDLWQYDLLRGERVRLSSGPMPRYSPGMRPGDGALSFVGVLPDGRQQLFSVPSGQSPASAQALPGYDQVGYYAWSGPDQAALFLVGDPHQLIWTEISTGRREHIAYHPGRALQVDDQGRIYYVRKDEDHWSLHRYDPATRSSRYLVRTPEGAEDFCLLADGSVLMPSGSMVCRYDPEKDLRWKPIADLRVYGLNQLNRIAVTADRRIALVNTLP